MDSAQVAGGRADHSAHAERPAEEVASAIVHGLGAMLAIAGLTLLVTFASFTGDAVRVASAAIFGACTVVLYLCSTLLHAIRLPRVERVLLECDYIAIYLLIAGTYTPLMLVGVGGFWGWGVFGMVWAVAAAGIGLRLLVRDRYPRLSLATYLAMGWMGVVAVVPIVRELSTSALVMIAAGGVAYTGGVAFFLWRSLPFNHAIWHFCVLMGTACHFVAVWREVIA